MNHLIETQLTNLTSHKVCDTEDCNSHSMQSFNIDLAVLLYLSIHMYSLLKMIKRKNSDRQNKTTNKYTR